MTYTDKGVVVNFRIPRSKLWGEPITLSVAQIMAQLQSYMRELPPIRRASKRFTLPKGSLD